jgi:hypothetical protein
VPVLRELSAARWAGCHRVGMDKSLALREHRLPKLHTQAAAS